MSSFFFSNDTATTEIYTLSLHDALPIWIEREPLCTRQGRRIHVRAGGIGRAIDPIGAYAGHRDVFRFVRRSEEHTSELQSQSNLVCRLLLEKKKKHKKIVTDPTLTSKSL